MNNVGMNLPEMDRSESFHYMNGVQIVFRQVSGAEAVDDGGIGLPFLHSEKIEINGRLFHSSFSSSSFFFSIYIFRIFRMQALASSALGTHSKGLYHGL
jgi:hypothetical protein